MAADSEEAKWLGVIGRCLAYLCLKNSEASNRDKREQAQFLEKLGLEIEDQAAVVGSTTASLRELNRQARRKKRGGGGKSKGKRKR